MAKRRSLRPQALDHRAYGPFYGLNVRFRLLTPTLTPSEVGKPDCIRGLLVTNKVETILGCKPRRYIQHGKILIHPQPRCCLQDNSKNRRIDARRGQVVGTRWVLAPTWNMRIFRVQLA